MKLQIKKATTDVTLYVFIPDADAGNGSGKTGLAYNTTNLVCYYVRPLEAAVQLALATQTVTGAHSDGGFVEISSANMPGVYRLDLSDAVCATGVNSVVVMLKGASDMAPVSLEVELVSYDPYDGVRAGLTALPSAAAEASGGLITRGTGTGQISVSGGRANVDVTHWATQAVATVDTNGYPVVTVKNGTGSGEITISSGIVEANVKAWDDGAVGTAATVEDVWSYASGSGRTLSDATNITSTGGAVTLDGDGHVTATATQVVASVSGTVGGVATGGITTASFATGAVNAAALGTGAITADKIASNAITSAKIATDAIGADQVAAAAVTKIAGGVLTTPANKLATDGSGRVTPRLERITKGYELANFHFPMKNTSGVLTTGLVGSITAQYVQDGAISLSSLSGAITEVGSTGIYKISLTAGETNCDVLTLVFSAAGNATTVVTMITQSQS